MVELEILAAVGDQRGDEPKWRPLVRLRVDRDDLQVEGDRNVLDFDMPVVSLRTGDQVRFEDDHEEWARSLRTAYRTGDVIVNVLHDDNPLRDDELAHAEVGVERHQVRLRERLGQSVH
jgi:hypothetical protein